MTDASGFAEQQMKVDEDFLALNLIDDRNVSTFAAEAASQPAQRHRPMRDLHCFLPRYFAMESAMRFCSS